MKSEIARKAVRFNYLTVIEKSFVSKNFIWSLLY